MTDDSVARQGDNYIISAGLVHKLIMAIFAAIITVGGYMIIWALNDAKWKAGVDAKLDGIQEKVAKLESEVDRDILPRAEERINNNRDRLMEHLENHP